MSDYRGFPSLSHADTSGGSVISQVPLPPAGPVFKDFFDGAREFGILKPSVLVEALPPLRVLESLKDDPERRAEIIHQCIGTFKSIILRRNDIARYAEDISFGMEEDPKIIDLFVDAVGTEYFLKQMKLDELYTTVMGTGWMIQSTPENRAFAVRLNESLVKHEAFGSAIDTLKEIMKAITLEELFGDAVPAKLRVRMAKAVDKGCRRFEKKRMCEFLFDPQIEGVPFAELAEHLPVEVMSRPFALYVDRLNLVKTNVDHPSLPPPADKPAHPPLPPPPPRPLLPRAIETGHADEGPHVEIRSPDDKG